MNQKTLLPLLGLVSLVPGARLYAQWGPTKVVAAKVEMRSLPVTMTLVGTVEPATRSVIGAEVAGLVIDMPARQGDLIKHGDLICKLNDDVLSLQLAREQAHLEVLQANLDELLNGTRPEVLARLKAELEAQAAVAKRWEFELARVMKLQGGDYANEKEYQDALAEQLAAENRRLAANASYEEAVAGPRTEVIAGARSAVAEQLAVVQRVQIERDKTRILAPFTGHVVQRHAEVGTWLAVGGDVVELAAMSSVLVRVDAPESAIPFAGVGAQASSYVDALKRSFEGTIKHVIPQADLAARTFPVEIEVANPDFALKAGMFATATIPAGADDITPAIPKDALIESRGSIQVALIVAGDQGTMAIPTPVTLGADDGEWIAVTSGNLPPDAHVAIYGNERLVFPQPVVVVQTRAEVDAPPQEKAGAAQAGDPAASNQTPFANKP